MQWFSSRFVGLAFFISVISGIAIYIYFDSFDMPDSKTYEEQILEQVHEMFYKQPLSDECSILLQELIQQNNNTYEIIVSGIYGDSGTHLPGKNTGSNEAIVRIVFPDKRQVELQYYNITLVTCHEFNPTTPVPEQ